jgi:hypothetical protein
MPASRSRRALLVLVAVAAVVLAGCGSDGDSTSDTTQPVVTEARPTTTEADPVANVVEREQALTALKDQIRALERGDWAGAWAALHPAQQALVSQSVFVACAAKRWGAAFDATEVHLVRVTKAQLDVPGTTVKGPGYRAEFRIVGIDARGPFDASTTYVTLQADGAWRWTVKDPAAYQSGACPPDDDTLT